MRYQTLIQAVQDIAESHAADLTFFNGLESDFDPASGTDYPALVMTPSPALLELGNEPAQASKTWKIHLEVYEQISDTASVTDKNEALDRTHEYLKDVILQLFFEYGYENKEVTVNNVTETLDFTITVNPELIPFIGEGDNLTGWYADFEIKEGLYEDLCHLPDIFN